MMNGSRSSGLLHTPAYVALISTKICPIFILMKVYCMCAYNIWCHKNGSSDISKALTRLGASSQSSAAIGFAGNARDGKWVPTQVAPQCVQSHTHKNACAGAIAPKDSGKQNSAPEDSLIVRSPD